MISFFCSPYGTKKKPQTELRQRRRQFKRLVILKGMGKAVLKRMGKVVLKGMRYGETEFGRVHISKAPTVGWTLFRAPGEEVTFRGKPDQ